MADDQADTWLPDDANDARLVGRIWRPEGPSVVLVERGRVFDVTAVAPTIADVLNHPEPEALWDDMPRTVDLGPFGDIARNSRRAAGAAGPRLLAPCDVQGIKACGVTFVRSLLERVIEERVRGNPAAAEALRGQLTPTLGTSLAGVVPGSPQAARLKERLIELGLWSQYLEVGIGPDVEVFTKAQPLSAVGFGAAVGILPQSQWNNPEPELVLAVSATGRVVGATLGNDVNLRDLEGRSALLLGRAKDNNASCAIGPLIRLLDPHFTPADLRELEIELEVTGADGFRDRATSRMTEISRDIDSLVDQAMGAHHQYPDGMMLFTGTMYTPTRNRGTGSQGFTHHPGDVVRLRSARLGTLLNEVDYTDTIAPWTFGIRALMSNLAARGYLGR